MQIKSSLIIGGLCLLIGCGDKKNKEEEKAPQATPEELCKKIFAERIEIKLFEKSGKKNEKAFHDYCVKQPIEYLYCESESLLSMEKEEATKCGKLINERQEKLNNVLEYGQPEGRK